MNRLGFASLCSLKIVVPHCGDSIYEPGKGEFCDDGNVASGDGCSNFCKVEPNWVCVEDKRCFRLQDPFLKTFCGNGIVEKAYG